MAKQSYRAVARLKLDDSNYLERGEKVDFTKDDDQSKVDNLITTGSVVTEEEFAVLFPNFDEEVEVSNDPVGTPSNLGDTPPDLQSDEGKAAAQAELDAKEAQAKQDAEDAQAKLDAETAAAEAKAKASDKGDKK